MANWYLDPAGSDANTERVHLEVGVSEEGDDLRGRYSTAPREPTHYTS